MESLQHSLFYFDSIVCTLCSVGLWIGVHSKEACIAHPFPHKSGMASLQYTSSSLCYMVHILWLDFCDACIVTPPPHNSDMAYLPDILSSLCSMVHMHFSFGFRLEIREAYMMTRSSHKAGMVPHGHILSSFGGIEHMPCWFGLADRPREGC